MSGPKSDKIWADAIRKAVHDYHEEKDASGRVKKTRYLNKLAANLVQAGIAGDVQAIREIGDRLDGKPKQESELRVTKEYVAVVPAQSETSDAWSSEHVPTTH